MSENREDGADPGRRLRLVDLHSHLVPGVDDGARTLEDTVTSVTRMMAAGFRAIVTTPHVNGSLTHHRELFEEEMARMDRAWAEALAAIEERHPDLEFRRGHEVKLDLPDVDLGDPRLALAGTDTVLVEWDRLQIPPGTGPVLRRITAEGRTPLIAHPERYGGMDRELRTAEEWKEAGALLQVNYGSLSGRYGPEARDLAVRLLERGLVDCFSTDFHGRGHLHLFVSEAREVMEGLGSEDRWELLAATNPGRILTGEAPLPVPPLPVETGWWGRIRNLLAGT